ncbi:CDP-diacylglycerol--serine O-phosphatidyltransferase [Candidatus Tachikawaea gelatinosa]|uniref:CDP-diacylglycerol--serine O-phosphatidyltransferase n=1 Tax=Candidatus Tachikawaea gelatinosa TaxID=1410383 RepID=UPI000596B461|nr:CDP-diacylglycerol--serine O-phosphatidyltransferase [Candidatus Tachikawaea gelatinosa]
MLSRFYFNQNKINLLTLPKIKQSSSDFLIIYSAYKFKKILLKMINKAKKRIYIVALFLENDSAGQTILNALYKKKHDFPNIEIIILVDWYRAQRGRIGKESHENNAYWYREMAIKNSNIEIPIYGIPINFIEVLGIFHVKGSIIDNTLLYTGASFNNIYLHEDKIYRYDRYQLIKNTLLANSMSKWIKSCAKKMKDFNRFDKESIFNKKKKNVRKKIRYFRHYLRNSSYNFCSNGKNNELTVTPLLGLGKKSLLNNTISQLIQHTRNKLIISTPYFNFPKKLSNYVNNLLKQGKKVEIIVGDKQANDFYAESEKDFQMINIIPYIYEINLRNFMISYQSYINNNQLTIYVWKNGSNSFHSKGLWIDKEWMLITGNNLNIRAWKLDLENGILIHDPLLKVFKKREKELSMLRLYTKKIQHFSEIENIDSYPVRIKKIIYRLKRTYIDFFIKKIL